MGGAGKAKARDVLEGGFAEPRGVFDLAVSVAIACADQHVQGKECCLLGRGLVGFEDEITDDDAAVGG